MTATPDPTTANRVFAHGARQTLCVTGPERLAWLNGLLTCDVKDVGPGVGAFGLALSRTGKVQSDIWLAASEDRVFLATASGVGASLLAELDRMLVMEDAQIDTAGDLGWLSVHGPQASAISALLAPDLQAVASGEVSLLQNGDWVVCAPRAALATLSNERLAALQPLGNPLNGLLGSEDDWQALRIEHGLPLFGVDYDSRHNPHDASLERRAVSWSKGCYLGQEVVCMQDLRGKAKRRMLPLALEGTPRLAKDTPVLTEGGASVGAVTSFAFSRALGCTVAMGWVEAEHAFAAGRFLVAGTIARALL